MPISIDDILERNIKGLHVRPEFRGRLIPPVPRQVELTRKWILPNIALILKDAYLLRREVDKELSRDPAILKRVADFEAQYPYGLCKPIRDAMLERIKAGMVEGRSQGLRILREFALDGGIIQPFWGIDKNMYFQNAIQIGDSVLDAANDTVNIKKDSVILYPSTRESAIRRIESFEEYAGVAEKYWHSDIYPNIYFPALAPVFPIISIKPVKEGRHILVLEADTGDLHFKNMFTEYRGHALGLSSLFLFESSYAAKRLPEHALESFLGGSILPQLQKKNPRIYRAADDPLHAAREFERFHLKGLKTIPPRLLKEADALRIHGLRLGRLPLAEWVIK
jgi:hypothetical protein